MKKKILLLVIGIIVAILVFSAYFYVSTFYTIKNIQIDGISDLQGSYALYNENLLLIDVKKVEQELIRRNPLVKKVDIYRKFPSTLTIVVQLSTPFAYLQIEKGYIVLSKEGKILSFVQKASQMPIIQYYQIFKQEEFSLGDSLNYKDIQVSIYFLEKMARLGFVIETVDINSLNVILFKNGEKKYFFSVEKDKELQYQTLKTILEYFKKENKDYKSIDLRFDKPVIRI
jgi:hypothetical protein